MSSYYGEIPILAQSLEPFSGLYLPVLLANSKNPGLLLLNERLGKRTFRATLYVSDTVGEIQAPIDLVSRGEWEDGDQRHIIENIIGKVVEIT